MRPASTFFNFQLSNSRVKNKRDSIILFGLKKKASLSAVNELLYEMHENIIE